MAKKQEISNWVWIVIALLLLIFLNQQGAIDILGNGEEPDFVIREEEVSEYATCSALCIANNWDTGYNANRISDCQAGESFTTYGYSGQIPLLSCCCRDIIITTPPVGDEYTCESSDGFDIYTSGWCQDSYHNLGFIEQCNGGLVQEYFCNVNNICEWSLETCPDGYVCSNGECVLSGYNLGDVVFYYGKAWDSLDGGYSVDLHLDTADIETGGPCRLGAKIFRSWDYAVPGCEGSVGTVDWNLFDSAGYRWGVYDTSPTTQTIEVCPCSWDGTTNWYFEVVNTKSPNCPVNFEYGLTIFVCECD